METDSTTKTASNPPKASRWKAIFPPAQWVSAYEARWLKDDLFESWGLPMAVITAVPFAIFGAILGVWLRGLENDVYFQIGLVTLVGLAAKNAILIVEFAVLRHREGLSIREAAIDAARLRLRAIIMTSLAFIFGMVPMFIAGGAGANSRHSVATGIIGGMIIASSIALFFIPMFFYLIERSGERFASAKKSSAKVPPAPERTSGLPATGG